MVQNDPNKKLEIKKHQLWELWLVSPAGGTILGEFPTLGELNQAQITLYHSFEHARFAQRPQEASLPAGK